MDTKLVHRKVVRNSILEAIQGIGTAAIGGVPGNLSPCGTNEDDSQTLILPAPRGR